MADLVIARRSLKAQFEPVERRFAGHWRTVLALRCKLARKHRHHRVMAQLVVIVDVLIAQCNPEHPLANQRFDEMFDQLRAAAIDEARGKALGQPDRTIRCSQKQCSSVRGDGSAIKSCHDGAASHWCKIE